MGELAQWSYSKPSGGKVFQACAAEKRNVMMIDTVHVFLFHTHMHTHTHTRTHMNTHTYT